MSNESTHDKSPLMTLAIVAGVAAGAYFWLRLSKKNGRDIIDSLCDMCDSATDKLEEVLGGQVHEAS